MLNVVDGGTAVVREAGRVDMSLTSQGIFSRMVGQAITITKTRVPGIRTFLHATFDALHCDSHAQLEKEGRAFERTVCYWVRSVTFGTAEPTSGVSVIHQEIDSGRVGAITHMNIRKNVTSLCCFL